MKHHVILDHISLQLEKFFTKLDNCEGIWKKHYLNEYISYSTLTGTLLILQLIWFDRQVKMNLQ